MQDLEAALALLPFWARAPGVALVPLGFAIGMAMTALAGLVARPRRGALDGAHWTERARAAHALGTAMGAAAGLSTSLLAMLAAFRVESGALATPIVATLTGVATLLGGLLTASLCDVARERDLGSPVPRTFGWIALWLLLAPQLLVLIGLACFVDASRTVSNLTVATLGVALYVLLAAGAGLRFARFAGALRPASPRLEAAIDRAAAKTRIRPRASFEVVLPVTNAFAVPILHWLLFTRSCVELFDDAQLEAIACHELAHLGEPMRVQVARVAGSLALLPLGFAPALMGAFGFPIGLGLTYAAMFAIGVPISRMCRRMEERADRVACEHVHDAAVYASALERLHEHNLVPAVLGNGRKTHPDLYDRMIAAGVVPPYPRPEPPSRRPVIAALFAVIAMLGAVTFGQSVIDRRDGSDGATRAALSIALFGATNDRLFEVARSSADRPEDSITFLRASLGEQEDDHAALALLATRLVALGRCDEGRRAHEAALAAASTFDRQHAASCWWISAAADDVGDCD